MTVYKLVGITNIVSKKTGEVYYKYNFCFTDERTNGLNVFEQFTKKSFNCSVGNKYNLIYNRNGFLEDMQEVDNEQP